MGVVLVSAGYEAHSTRPTRDDVAGAGTTYGNLREAMFGRQMQVCVALLVVVGIAQVVGVVANDALHQRQVVEQDGATQAPRYINPELCQRMARATSRPLPPGLVLHVEDSEAWWNTRR